ncbi:MAG: hypothetical protein MJ102_08450 [Clostridia bacterium]|nr:hypothetical protein [Clostridia bacterium]
MASTIIDFHSHILPGADHGSASPSESQHQIALLRSAGMTSIVATPHFYPKYTSVRDFILLRERCLRDLKRIKRPDDPVIYLGAEVTLCRNLDKMPELDLLTVVGTDTLLIELPGDMDTSLVDTLIRIRSAGFNVVVAHPDRYRTKISEEVFSLGFRGQLNAEAFGIRSLLRRKRLLSWVDQGFIAAVGSDLHGTDTSYAQNISHMVSAFGDENLNFVASSTADLLSGAVPVDQM